MRKAGETPPLETEHIEAILEFLPLFERSDFRAYHGINDGYYNWSPELERFHKVLYSHNWVIPFDWPEWQEEAEQLIRSEEGLERADMDVLRKLLTTIARKEHFVTNVLPIACDDGTMTRILRRVKTLHEETGVPD